jgi:hypothetical protein
VLFDYTSLPLILCFIYMVIKDVVVLNSYAWFQVSAAAWMTPLLFWDIAPSAGPGSSPSFFLFLPLKSVFIYSLFSGVTLASVPACLLPPSLRTCHCPHLTLYNYTLSCCWRSPWAPWPLKVGPKCGAEPSVTTSQCCVISQKSKDLLNAGVLMLVLLYP